MAGVRDRGKDGADLPDLEIEGRAAVKDVAKEGHGLATIHRWRCHGRHAGTVDGKGGHGRSAGRTENVFG